MEQQLFLHSITPKFAQRRRDDISIYRVRRQFIVNLLFDVQYYPHHSQIKWDSRLTDSRTLLFCGEKAARH